MGVSHEEAAPGSRPECYLSTPIGHALGFGENDRLRTLLMASQPYILKAMPEINVSVPHDGGGVGDGTFMLPPPTSALSGRNVLYLPSEMSDHR